MSSALPRGWSASGRPRGPRAHGLSAVAQLDDVAALNLAEPEVVAAKLADVVFQTLPLFGELHELVVGVPLGDKCGDGGHKRTVLNLLCDRSASAAVPESYIQAQYVCT